jgi:hypothetical protein
MGPSNLDRNRSITHTAALVRSLCLSLSRVPSLIFTRTPPNCTFEVDDYTSPWRFSYPFDFIHARGVEGSVSDYPALFSSALNALAPGGWFEAVEATVGVFCDDDTADQAPSFLEWRDRLIEASEKFGRPMGVAQNFRQWVSDAGFEEVHEEVYKVGDSGVAEPG